MTSKSPAVGSCVSIGTAQLQMLIDALRGRGYRTIGPRIVDDAIVYADLDSINQLPVGYIDCQDGGSYRLEKSEAAGSFDYASVRTRSKNTCFRPAKRCLRAFLRTARGKYLSQKLSLNHSP